MQTRRGLESADQSVLLHRSTIELCLLFACFRLRFYSSLFSALLLPRFFFISNFTGTDCGIALNYLLSVKMGLVPVSSFRCFARELYVITKRNKAQNSEFVGRDSGLSVHVEIPTRSYQTASTLSLYGAHESSTHGQLRDRQRAKNYLLYLRSRFFCLHIYVCVLCIFLNRARRIS